MTETGGDMKFFANLSRLAVLTAFLLLTACSSTPNQESTGEFFDSSVITAKVKARLIDDPLTGGFRIKVNTHKGTVELTGTVYTVEEKARAGKIAASVEGVQQVSNQLLVQPPK